MSKAEACNKAPQGQSARGALKRQVPPTAGPAPRRLSNASLSNASTSSNTTSAATSAAGSLASERDRGDRSRLRENDRDALLRPRERSARSSVSSPTRCRSECKDDCCAGAAPGDNLCATSDAGGSSSNSSSRRQTLDGDASNLLHNRAVQQKEELLRTMFVVIDVNCDGFVTRNDVLVSSARGVVVMVGAVGRLHCVRRHGLNTRLCFAIMIRAR